MKNKALSAYYIATIALTLVFLLKQVGDFIRYAFYANSVVFAILLSGKLIKRISKRKE